MSLSYKSINIRHTIQQLLVSQFVSIGLELTWLTPEERKMLTKATTTGWRAPSGSWKSSTLQLGIQETLPVWKSLLGDHYQCLHLSHWHISRDSGKSRADLWAFAALMAVEFGKDTTNIACLEGDSSAR